MSSSGSAGAPGRLPVGTDGLVLVGAPASGWLAAEGDDAAARAFAPPRGLRPRLAFSLRGAPWSLPQPLRPVPEVAEEVAALLPWALHGVATETRSEHRVLAGMVRHGSTGVHLTLLLAPAAGGPAIVGKATTAPERSPTLAAEDAALRWLAAHPSDAFAHAAPLAYRTEGTRSLLLSERLLLRRPPRGALVRALPRVLTGTAAVPPPQPLTPQGALDAVRGRVEEAPAEVGTRLAELLEPVTGRTDDLVPATSHGDLTPWNIAWRDGGPVLLDWENWGTRTLGWDLAHLLWQERIFSRRSPRPLLRLHEAPRWTGTWSALRDPTGRVPRPDPDLHLLVYLVDSAAGIARYGSDRYAQALGLRLEAAALLSPRVAARTAGS